MGSDPIADAHEQRAQRVEGQGDANDEEFGSHEFHLLVLGSLRRP
jgi:hypothetical protein